MVKTILHAANGNNKKNAGNHFRRLRQITYLKYLY